METQRNRRIKREQLRKKMLKNLAVTNVELITSWIPGPISAPELDRMIVATTASEAK